MTHKKIYLYLLLALLVLVAIGTGYYLWRGRQEIRVPQGTLVDAGENMVNTDELGVGF